MAERQLDLLDALAGPDRIDGHPGLEAPAGRERDQGAQCRDAHRALARERRLEAGPAEPLDRLPRVADGEAESPALRAREPGDGEIAPSLLDGLDQGHELARALTEVGVAEQRNGIGLEFP